MFERGFAFFKPKVVKGEGPSTPEPGRAEAFVAAAKGPQPPKKVEMANGRPVYSETPVMANGEQLALDRKVIEQNLQNPAELLKGGIQDPAYEKLKGKITRAGYYDLDEKVEMIGSPRATEAEDSQSGFSDSTREALSLAEQKERFSSLSEEVAALEAELEAIPVDEPLAWKEKNDALKPKRAELDALGKLLADTAKTGQPN